MRSLYLFSIWLHLLAAIVWLGGMLFLVLVLVPVLRRQEYRGIIAALLERTGEQFRWIGWICLALLTASGLLNLAYRGVIWDSVLSGALWQGAWGQTLGIKLALVAVVLVLSAVHDFRIGPRTTALWRTNPNAPELTALRRRTSWIGRVNLLLALVIVALAVALVRGLP